MKLSLVVMNSGKATGKTIPVPLPQFIIGRDPQCQLRPASALISKRHCALIARGDKYYIRDFDSTNGTFVNTEPVKGERELKHDDILAAGPLTFRVVIEGTPAEAKAPATAPAKAAATAPAKAAAKAPAPAPAGHKTAVPHNTAKSQAASDEDDSIGDMMLDMADEGDADSSPPPSVPEGTTIMDGTPIGAAPGTAGDTKTDAVPAKESKPPDKKKGLSGDTSAAAMALLQKYMRRERQ